MRQNFAGICVFWPQSFDYIRTLPCSLWHFKIKVNMITDSSFYILLRTCIFPNKKVFARAHLLILKPVCIFEKKNRIFPSLYYCTLPKYPLFLMDSNRTRWDEHAYVGHSSGRAKSLELGVFELWHENITFFRL